MDADEIEQVATEWLVRRESARWSKADQAQFAAWYDADPAHRIAFMRMEVLWRRLSLLQGSGAGIGPATTKTTESRVSEPTSRKVQWRIAALAAGILLFAVGCLALYTRLYGGTHYTTPVGGVEQVALPDGTRVTLNTDTSIVIRYSETERGIELRQGEAYFEVEKDKTRPFAVEARGHRVVALGTAFSVRIRGDDVEVVISEGCVRIASPDARSMCAPATARTLKGHVIPGSAAKGDVEKRLSWRSGYVVFDSMTLREAVDEFNRYNRRQIVIEDPSIAGIPFGGRMLWNDMETFLSLVSDDPGIEVEQKSDRVVLRAK